MGLLDGFNNLFSTSFGGRSNNDNYSSPVQLDLNPLDLDRRADWVSIEGKEEMYYETTAELKIVVDRLALMFSNGVFKVVDNNGNEIEGHEVLSLLENPNVLQSRNEFLFQWWVQRSLYPSTFMYQLKGFNAQEIPTALWNLSPSRMIINRTGKIWQQTELDRIISSYEFSLDNSAKTELFETNEIIQFSMPSSDDPILGSSPLNAIKMPLSNIRAAYAYRNVILTKKGALGVWSSDTKDAIGSVALNSKEQKEIEDLTSRIHGIGDSQRATAVSRNALKFTPATFPTRDLLLFEEVDAGKSAIIDLYGANKNMFSMDKSSTFTNVEAAEKNCYQDTIIPTANDFTNGISKRFGLLEKNQRIILDYSHVPTMQSDEKETAETTKLKVESYEKLILNGMNETEAREIVGL